LKGAREAQESALIKYGNQKNVTVSYRKMRHVDIRNANSSALLHLKVIFRPKEAALGKA
jgi:hypothetical protein